MFSGSVNSPLKPPPSNIPRGDNAGAGAGGRKLSASHNQGHMNTYNTSSPGSVRPGPRRRETGDSIGNAMSPTAGGSRFLREEPNTSTPPPSLLRRKTDFRDATSGSKLEERDKDPSGHEGETTSPFGSLKRSNTNPLASGAGGTSSPWGSASQSASFSPMGTFGAFNLGSGTGQTPTEKKSSFGSLRGESRLKGLLSKDSSEDIPASAKERTSIGNLERLSEQDSEKRSQSPWGENFKTRTGRSDTNPFVEEPRSGSAALGGSQDIGGPSQDPEQLGFSAFGMTPSIPGFRELMQSDDHSRNPSPSLLQGHEPTSPTNTNPYQSPHGEKAEDDVDTDGSDIQSSQPHGLGGLRESSGPFGSMRRVGSGLDMPSIDRSQTSSAAGNRNFPGLGGLGGHSNLGGSSGWPSSSAAVGTPTREKSAFASGFGDPIFGSMADLQSPSLSTLGGGGFFGSNAGMTGSGSIGRSSKLGSLFPTSMQEQTQGDQARQEFGGFDEGTRQPGKTIQSNCNVELCMDDSS
jgi:PERQ amino acid-rich with GYF domain-containing protein